MRTLSKFSPKHLPVKRIMGHERGSEPKACKQEHVIPIGKERGYTSNYNWSFLLKKRRHKPQGRTTSIKTKAYRAPTSEGSPNGVKYGLCSNKTHHVNRCSEQGGYKRTLRIREGRPNEVRKRSRAHSTSEKKKETVEKEARNRRGEVYANCIEFPKASST